MSHRQRNHKRKETAWSHVVGEIRKRAKRFERETTEYGCAPTQIDMDKSKEELFGPSGRTSCVYCQCESWFDNWEYSKGGN